MAVTKLGILIKTMYDGKGTKAATKDMTTLGKATSQATIKQAAMAQRSSLLSNKMSDLGRQVAQGTMSTKDAAKAFDEYKKSLPVQEIEETTKQGMNMKGMLTKLGIAAGAVGAALYTAKKAFDFSREGAALNQLGKSFDLMNKEVFKTPGLLDKMKDAAKGTVKDTDLMKGLLTLTAGATREVSRAMAQASPQLIKIAKAANKLNPLLGDTGFLYDSLALGIKRASPMILDNLGLTIKVGQANEEYAESIGKTVKELSAQEKQLALLGAALKAGDTLIEQVGGNVDSQTDSWDQLTVAIGNTLDKVKMAAGELVVTNYDEEATRYLAAVKKIEDAIASGIISQRDFNRMLEDSFIGAIHMEQQWIDIADSIKDFSAEASSASQIQAQLDTELTTRAAPALEDQITLWGGYAESMATGSQGYKDLIKQNKLLADEEARLAAETEEAEEATAALVATLKAEEEAARVVEERFAQIQAGIQSMLAPMGGNELSLFNEDLDQLGYRLVTVGGRTADQNRLWNQATDEVDALGQKITDMSAAPVLFSKTADEAAESIEGWTDRINELNPLIDVLGSVTSTTSSYIQEATWDYDALTTALFNTTAGVMGREAALLNTAEAERAAQEAVLGLGVSLGQLTQIQADAMLQQYIMYNVHLPALAEMFEAGEISADEMREAMFELAEGEYETAEQAIRLKKEMELAKIALDNIVGIYEIQINERRTRWERTVQETDWPGQTPPTQPPTQPPVDDDWPGGQHGFSGVVPPGYPNDSYGVRATSGEHVQITPAGKGRGGNVLVQQFFNIRGGGNPLYIAQEAANQAANILGDKMRG